MRVAGWFAILPLSLASSTEVPWVPTRQELISHIMRIARVQRNDVFYDLGCGDGRVAIAAAKRGARAVCVEIREDLIREAMRKAKEEGVEGRVKFVRADFRQVDISDATVVYMYLLTRVNESLKPKLSRELALGTRIVTLDFEIPGWRPVHIERYYTGGLERIIYLYIRGVSDATIIRYA